MKLLREPLVHFFLLGAGIFLLSALVSESGENRPGEIVATPGQVERLAETWQRTWQRPPTRAELEGLVEHLLGHVSLKTTQKYFVGGAVFDAVRKAQERAAVGNGRGNFLASERNRQVG